MRNTKFTSGATSQVERAVTERHGGASIPSVMLRFGQDGGYMAICYSLVFRNVGNIS